MYILLSFNAKYFICSFHVYADVLLLFSSFLPSSMEEMIQTPPYSSCSLKRSVVREISMEM